MDALLAIFLSWQFMIFCLGLAGMGFVFRKLIEYFILDNPHLPGNKHSMIWRSLILPIAPVVSGAIAAYLAKGYPYPQGLGTSEYGRVSFGLVAGLLSGLVYRVISEILRSKMAQGYVAGAAGTPMDTTSIQDGNTTQLVQVSMPSTPAPTTQIISVTPPNSPDLGINLSTAESVGTDTTTTVTTTVTKPTDSQ